MKIGDIIKAALIALTEWFKTASIRERRELRNEAKTLRHEATKAADAGNTPLLAELQNALADNQRDSAFILAAACPARSKGD